MNSFEEEALGWTESLRQQKLSPKGRKDVPDGLLFESVETKAKANGFPEEWKRYEFGRAVVESKRWAACKEFTSITHATMSTKKADSNRHHLLFFYGVTQVKGVGMIPVQGVLG